MPRSSQQGKEHTEDSDPVEGSDGSNGTQVGLSMESLLSNVQRAREIDAGGEPMRAWLQQNFLRGFEGRMWVARRVGTNTSASGGRGVPGRHQHFTQKVVQSPGPSQ